MNYSEIIIRGFLDENTRNILETYFLREYKIANRDKFIEADEFFNGCLKVVEVWEKDFEKESFTYLKELINTLEKTKDGTIPINAMNGKPIKQSKQDIIEYYEGEIKNVQKNGIVASKNAGITKTLYLPTDNGRISYNLTYFELLLIKHSILIAFQKNQPEQLPKEKVLQPQLDDKKEDEQPVYLIHLFEYTSKYYKIMKILADKGYIEPNTDIWKDEKKGNKSLLISLIKDLRNKGYFKENMKPTNQTIINICKNTFGATININTAKHANNIDSSNSKNKKANLFSFIPIASTLK